MKPFVCPKCNGSVVAARGCFPCGGTGIVWDPDDPGDERAMMWGTPVPGPVLSHGAFVVVECELPQVEPTGFNVTTAGLQGFLCGSNSA
jgi:hypothetical protein